MLHQQYSIDIENNSEIVNENPDNISKNIQYQLADNNDKNQNSQQNSIELEKKDSSNQPFNSVEIKDPEISSFNETTKNNLSASVNYVTMKNLTPGNTIEISGSFEKDKSMEVKEECITVTMDEL